MKKLSIILLILLLITSCGIKETPHSGDNELEDNDLDVNAGKKVEYIINKNAMTLNERYPAPKGYHKLDLEEGSFGAFLRNQELKAYGEKVLYYDGRTKEARGIYDSVFKVDIGDRDLHQCADAIMLLRAEYLYSQGLYDEISFSFVSGFKAEYKKWMEGYRIKVEGNNVSYYKATEASNSYQSFRKYMDIVMAYASTLSLEKELDSVNIDDIEVGHVFIIGGSPGHAIIVVDMAINENGEKIFLLAQSYMPAQETQLLLNPMDESLSPWYSLKGKDKLVTPEWTFDLDNLKSF